MAVVSMGTLAASKLAVMMAAGTVALSYGAYYISAFMEAPPDESPWLVRISAVQGMTPGPG
jgi:hypothetical protein